jgi:hypothetical protein
MSAESLEREVRALDQIHALLESRPEGLTASRIAIELSLDFGYVQGLLSLSRCVLKRKGYKWVVDYSDFGDWKPQFNSDDLFRAKFVRHPDGHLVKIFKGKYQTAYNVFKRRRKI